MDRSLKPPLSQPLWSQPFSLICLSNFLLFANFQLLLSPLSLFIQEIGGREGMEGWMMGAFTFAAVVVRPWIGRLVDRFGSYPFLLTGLIFFFLCTLGYLWIEAVVPLLLLRIVHGLAWGWVWDGSTRPASMDDPICTGWSDRKSHSAFFTALDLGIGLGSILAGILAQQAGYSLMFLLFMLPPATALLLFLSSGYPVTQGKGLNESSIKNKATCLYHAYRLFIWEITHPIAGGHLRYATGCDHRSRTSLRQSRNHLGTIENPCNRIC